MILETKLLKNEKHQTRVSLLLELVSDAYLTANRTRYMWSSTQETTPLDHASPTTSRSQAAENDSRLCRTRNTQNPLCGKTKAAPLTTEWILCIPCAAKPGIISSCL